jgi:hypothetical protein
MTGGPPLSMPTIKTPPRAVQHVTIEKEKPIMPMRLKLRWSSEARLAGCRCNAFGSKHTLFIAQVGESCFLTDIGVEYFGSPETSDERRRDTDIVTEAEEKDKRNCRIKVREGKERSRKKV